MLLTLSALVLLATPVQAATVSFDLAPGATVAEATSWTATLYVNGTAFALTTTCVAAGPVVTCTAPLPAITAALTPAGPQTFEVDLFDPVLNARSLKSAPFLRSRPSAPINGRLQ
jgi:hypothetical protein